MELDTCRELVQDTNYLYKGQKVARVTKVLATMLMEESTIQFANTLGFRKLSYTKILETAAEKGTVTHALIENFLTTGELPQYETIHPFLRNAVTNAFNSFMDWWTKINETCDVKVIYVEHQLITKKYGGTMDLLIKINGEYYIVDFKTSSGPSFKYFIQLASYKNAIEELEPIKIKGCIVLQLSKTKTLFNEFVADYTNPADRDFMNNCLELFFYILDGYYQRLLVEDQYDKYLIRRKGEKQNERG